MFVIKDITSNYYFHKGNKIIIFEDFNTAQEMLNNFFNYSKKKNQIYHPINFMRKMTDLIHIFSLINS